MANSGSIAKAAEGPPTAREAAAEAAAAAGLRYVADDEPGYSRRRRGAGFSYQRPGGEAVSSAERRRIEDLVIPPAWQEVWISLDPKGHLQATGRDEAGRKQYLYHPRWTAARDAAKFAGLAGFGDALPALRRRLRRDLKSDGLSRRKLTAAVLRLMDQTLIRVGNAAYAKANGSYGLTTLRNKHVRLSGDEIDLRFKGKSGEKHVHSLVDEELASVVRECQELPGYELFRYRDEAGEVQTIDSRDVNDYLRQATSREVSAKDFRTWGGTVATSRALHAALSAAAGNGKPASRNGNRANANGKPAGGEAALLHAEASESARHKAVVEAVKSAAEILGNTPAICRQSYVHPTVIESFLAAEFHDSYAEALARARSKRPRELRLHEAATLGFLQAAHGDR